MMPGAESPHTGPNRGLLSPSPWRQAPSSPPPPATTLFLALQWVQRGIVVFGLHFPGD